MHPISIPSNRHNTLTMTNIPSIPTLQATWALGNLLLLILPRRQLFTFPSGSIVGSSGLTGSGLSGSGLMGSGSPANRGGMLSADGMRAGGMEASGKQPDWTDDSTWLSLCRCV